MKAFAVLVFTHTAWGTDLLVANFHLHLVEELYIILSTMYVYHGRCHWSFESCSYLQCCCSNIHKILSRSSSHTVCMIEYASYNFGFCLKFSRLWRMKLIILLFCSEQLYAKGISLLIRKVPLVRILCLLYLFWLHFLPVDISDCVTLKWPKKPVESFQAHAQGHKRGR